MAAHLGRRWGRLASGAGPGPPLCPWGGACASSPGPQPSGPEWHWACLEGGWVGPAGCPWLWLDTILGLSLSGGGQLGLHLRPVLWAWGQALSWPGGGSQSPQGLGVPSCQGGGAWGVEKAAWPLSTPQAVASLPKGVSRVSFWDSSAFSGLSLACSPTALLVADPAPGASMPMALCGAWVFAALFPRAWNRAGHLPGSPGGPRAQAEGEAWSHGLPQGDRALDSLSPGQRSGPGERAAGLPRGGADVAAQSPGCSVGCGPEGSLALGAEEWEVRTRPQLPVASGDAPPLCLLPGGKLQPSGPLAAAPPGP